MITTTITKTKVKTEMKIITITTRIKENDYDNEHGQEAPFQRDVSRDYRTYAGTNGRIRN